MPASHSPFIMKLKWLQLAPYFVHLRSAIFPAKTLVVDDPVPPMILSISLKAAFVPVILSVLVYFLVSPFQVPPVPHQTSILVTGASSGIGQAAALALANEGYLVFAGVRSDASSDRLLAIAASSSSSSTSSTGNLHPIILDVTVPSHIESAITTITNVSEQRSRTFTAIVNNAGVQNLTPLELSDQTLVKDLFDVNVFAPLSLTQALLPLLRRAPSPRIVNVGSVAGFLTPPFYGVYAASKHAIEAMSDAWRRELAPENVVVSLLQPGSIDTPIEGKMLEQLGAVASSRYSAKVNKFASSIKFLLNHPYLSKLAFSPTSKTTSALVHALQSSRPKTRYLVGADAFLWHYVNFLPGGVIDLVFSAL
jgi:NAD(P)-dependent dehydrogenase (short-subunit alcohol dehydrogenase family)